MYRLFLCLSGVRCVCKQFRLPKPKGGIVVCDHLKHRFVGQGGEMLRTILRRVVADGEVTGFSVFDSPSGALSGVLCGYCANDLRHLISLEIQKQDELGTSTRLVTASVCLPLCTDCWQKLKKDFKTTAG
jgi:hypothetical protein